ncbi:MULTISPECIES: hypothetical protein [unclassified Wolbachia]|uniref:hypothetical protein n=1 Tax=unclassified Wolbachia TaxID=2640676 RepID=UPI00221E58E9|nr:MULTISPECIES: hypothetical protein [unclassified Wolbachia]
MPQQMKVSNCNEYNKFLQERGNIFHLGKVLIRSLSYKSIKYTDEVREYLNHILKQPSTSVDGAQAQSLAGEKKQL